MELIWKQINLNPKHDMLIELKTSQEWIKTNQN